MAAADLPKDIVIIGGGIIGCTTAYFLTRHPLYNPSKHSITLLEASKIAGGASGKAGGLLGLWAYPSCIVPLSYRLHAELAAEHGGEQRWGYRQIHCGQLSAKGRSPLSSNGKGQDSQNTRKEASVSLQKRDSAALDKLTAAGLPKDLSWVSPDSAEFYYQMGNPNTTAQVHPYQFTTSMASLAEEAGVKIICGAKVTSVGRFSANRDPEQVVHSVSYNDSATKEEVELPATDVVIAAGPWTQRIWPSAPISALRAHSVTIRPAQPISAYALFTEIELPKNFGKTDTFQKQMRKHSKKVSPEIYARPNNEAYCCGEGDILVPLPETSADVVTDDARCQDIVDYVTSISDELRNGEVLVRQACYLANVQSRIAQGPLIGNTHVKGVILAAGHTCWGIQNGPGTGKIVSELVLEGVAKSAKINSLDPRQIM